MSIVFLFISLLLQGMLSLYLPFTSNHFTFLSYNFIIITLVLIYPIYHKKRQISLYYIICILYGLLFDLLYTNALVIDSLLFLFIGMFVKMLYVKFSENFLNLFFIIVLSQLLYDILFYLLLVLFRGISFSLWPLLYQFVNCVFLNLIYSFIWYNIVAKYKEKIKPMMCAAAT